MADASSQEFLTFIAHELRRLHHEMRSGTLFATTMNQKLAQFGIDHGEVVYLSFNNVEGREGLERLCEQRVGTGVARFAEGRHRGARHDLPSFEELMHLMQKGGAPGQAPQKTAVRKLTQEMRGVIEHELTEMIGPYAAVLCEEKLDTAATLDEALTLIGRELPEAALAQRLRDNVRRRLGLG